MISKHHLFLAAALLLGGVQTSSAFVSPQKHNIIHQQSTAHNFQQQQNFQNILHIRGGDISNMASTSALSSAIAPITEALVSGTPLRAIGALYAVSSLTVVPLTWYKTAYSFSVGYGLSVAAMSAVLLSTFNTFGGGFNLSTLKSLSAPSILALTAMVYGVRLAAFIFVRAATVPEKGEQFKKMNSTPVLKRTPLALGVSLLYAMMVSPALMAFRGSVEAGSVSHKAQLFFTGMATFGMVLESIADQHKFEVKRKGTGGDDKFVGPTSWSYKLCRHPNYLGEILHWVGIFGAGSVTFGKSIVPWASGVLGLWGILTIMLGASSRLDTKQAEKYGGQPAYDDWKKKVTSSVIPLIK
jgi:steroid 5-alpha reductase family enzyme